jgi:flavin-dependent dehydrogenase
MITSDVIIVGGGPAGSSCAWKLLQQGIDCIILDREKFPRTKLCAGWITPQVIQDLEMDMDDYVDGVKQFKSFSIHIYNKTFEIPVNQYAIRRVEFDHWLLKRSGVTVFNHTVQNIKKTDNQYVIDDRFACQYLIGAGGTFCPVFKVFFRPVQPRKKRSRVVTLECEFSCKYSDENCHLWFFQNKLPGYAWYVPKLDGYLNIGIGGKFSSLQRRNDTINSQWQLFTKELQRLGLINTLDRKPGGSVYYIRDRIKVNRIDNVFLTGDALGLATKDMGEGIGPAIKSGILAANAIISNKPYKPESISTYSFPRHKTASVMLKTVFPEWLFKQ